MYSVTYAMGHQSKTKTNLTSFTKTLSFLLDLWKGLADLNLRLPEVLKKITLL